MRTSLSLVAVLALGCTVLPDGDARRMGEAGVGFDAAARDAGRSDSGRSDSGSVDSGTPDSGAEDAGPTDSGAADSGPNDSGVHDAGTDACTPGTYFGDCDGDGYGAGDPVERCAESEALPLCSSIAAAPRWVDVDGDCDDTDTNISPAAADLCDNVDNDCDGTVDGLVANADCVEATSEMYCVDGGCRNVCPTTHHVCGGVCASLFSRDHCQDCGVECAFTCQTEGCTGAAGIDARGNRTCAWQDRYLACWGEAPSGTIPPTSSTPRTLPAFPERVVDVAVGGSHQCAITVTSTLNQIWCWGKNEHGQLGLLDRVDRIIPHPVTEAPTSKAVEVVAGDGFSCARTDTNEVWCWGQNTQGIVSETLPTLSVPRPVRRPGVVAEGLVAGDQHVCAWNSAQVQCWGRVPNYEGESGTVTVWSVPRASVQSVAAGTGHVCVLFKDDAAPDGIDCFGDNSMQQLGSASAGSRYVQRISAGGVQVAAGRGHTCVVVDVAGAGHDVYCFGAGLSGQLGGSGLPSAAPYQFAYRSTRIAAGALSLGDRHSCYLEPDGVVACWGSNAEGQLGVATAAGGPSAVNPPF